jgi:hypothetical protein
MAKKSYIESMLGEHEKIVYVTHQHWFILFSSIFLEIALILIIFAGTVLISIALPIYAILIVAGGFILFLMPLATMTRDILEWTNRQYIITNRRVIQIAGIFNKKVTDSSLEKVNDVKMVQTAFGRIFDYGDVEILTASELGVNLFRRIEDPVHFKTSMLNAKENLEHGPSQPSPRDEVPALIEKLDQLRQRGVISQQEFDQKKSDLLSKL